MHAHSNILIADRDPNGLSAFTEDLDLEFQCTFQHVFTDDELETSLNNSSVHILILDLNFSREHDGLLFIDFLKNSHPGTTILPIIPAGQPHIIKEILKRDLFFYIHKPINPLETAIALKRIYETTATPRTSKKISIKKAPSATFHGMIGTSEPMRRLFELITKIAEDDYSTVLIRGESGTGKEMVAKAIHAQSKRRKENFVPVNCAAIPDDLLESELFGYIKGAFTGAASNKPGRIQYADKGTLFLDEIGDMKSSLQAKLLRVLQEKEFEPVGAFKPIPVDTRILAATHCDLEQLVSEGTFREDLYYRLSVIPLNIPPLKERTEDILQLINSFITTYTVKRGREQFSFSSLAISSLIYYEWRGNVRELENLIQHMSILYSGKVVQATDLPEKFQEVEIPDGENNLLSETVATTPPPQNGPAQASFGNVAWEKGSVNFKELINDFETQLIVQAMKLTEGNKKEAAQLLNLKRTTLLEKIKKKNITGLWED
jgi:DNA-binding NtrC family response regulator